MTITDVPGIRVGHWTDRERATGVTVVVVPDGNVAAVEVRGAAPGTRETALLQPGMRVESVQAIVLSGGSAFGLAAADGVVGELARLGRGQPTPAGPVPIVPAAILYDLLIGLSDAHPGPEEGALAFVAATDGPVEQGSVGAGTGAVVAGWRGSAAMRKGGVGSAAVRVGDAVVGALVVANAVGDVFTLEGRPLTGGPHVPDWADARPPSPHTNTTLVVVATDMRLERTDLLRLLVRAHDALGTCLRPGHTRYDGDAAFAVSCGEVPGDPDAAGEAVFAVVGRSLEAAVLAAEPVGGVTAVSTT